GAGSMGIIGAVRSAFTVVDKKGVKVLVHYKLSIGGQTGPDLVFRSVDAEGHSRTEWLLGPQDVLNELGQKAYAIVREHEPKGFSVLKEALSNAGFGDDPLRHRAVREARKIFQIKFTPSLEGPQEVRPLSATVAPEEVNSNGDNDITGGQDIGGLNYLVSGVGGGASAPPSPTTGSSLSVSISPSDPPQNLLNGKVLQGPQNGGGPRPIPTVAQAVSRAVIHQESQQLSEEDMEEFLAAKNEWEANQPAPELAPWWED
ncbi:MAG TPA: hypothetical protein VI877_02910, partial [Dehalococcoidia bacterium]|nr:hypothetical protein [Dehalococcoidia bacterium]